jgi:serine/threonine-protein kinase HipA
MARILHVWLRDKLVGELQQDEHGQLRFRYAAAWLAAPDALPLSVSLPLRAEPFSQKLARPFFAGLLPEETNRGLIAKSFGISKNNDFALLDRIGGECAGAVSLMPEGAPPNGSEPGAYEPIDDATLARLLADLPKRPLLAGQKGLRLSLAGAQNKMAVARTGEGYAMPLNGAPSTHILKPPSPHFAGLIENECYCMKLAATVGLNVAGVRIGRAQDSPFLEIERYDRRHLPDGTLERIHQEDFCQALCVAPELKYQSEGGPGLKRCFELVRSVSSVPAVDLLRLFDAVVFNYLIGNGDAHGKNFSLLYEGRDIRLAPLYDLVCTQAYPELSRAMAMKLGGERNPEDVVARNWRKFADEAGFGQPVALRRIHEMAQRVLNAVEKLASEYGDTSQVPAVVRGNCSRVLAQT